MRLKLGKKYAPVKITDGFDKRRFKINYFENEIIPRPQMDRTMIESHGVKWRTLEHHDLRQESFNLSRRHSRLNMTLSPDRSRQGSKSI